MNLYKITQSLLHLKFTSLHFSKDFSHKGTKKIIKNY